MKGEWKKYLLLMLYNDIMKSYITSLQKYNPHIFFSRKGRNRCVCVCEREGTRTPTGGGLLYWLFLLGHAVLLYSGPHLRLLLFGWECTAPLWSLARRSPWLTMSAWLCVWPRLTSNMGTCIYTISQRPRFPVVNPRELLTAVIQRELLTPTHRSLPVYTVGTWRLCQRSICNMDITSITLIITKKWL